MPPRGAGVLPSGGEESAMALSVLIADDHELFRSGLKQLLVDELGADIVREA